METQKEIQQTSDYNPIVLYTDGSCRGNPGGVGGWGCVLTTYTGGIIRVLSGGELSTTNNRMELLAVIKGLEDLPITKDIVINTDSMYVIDTYNKGETPVKNADLWDKFFYLVEPFDNIKFEWVAGHKGHPYNEIADTLATNASGDLKHWLINERHNQKRIREFKKSGAKYSKSAGSMLNPESLSSPSDARFITTTDLALD